MRGLSDNFRARLLASSEMVTNVVWYVRLGARNPRSHSWFICKAAHGTQRWRGVLWLLLSMWYFWYSFRLSVKHVQPLSVMCRERLLLVTPSSGYLRSLFVMCKTVTCRSRFVTLRKMHSYSIPLFKLLWAAHSRKTERGELRHLIQITYASVRVNMHGLGDNDQLISLIFRLVAK